MVLRYWQELSLALSLFLSFLGDTLIKLINFIYFITLSNAFLGASYECDNRQLKIIYQLVWPLLIQKQNLFINYFLCHCKGAKRKKIEILCTFKNTQQRFLIKIKTKNIWFLRPLANCKANNFLLLVSLHFHLLVVRIHILQSTRKISKGITFLFYILNTLSLKQEEEENKR